MEWFGLTLNEARLKQELIEEEESSQKPLKYQFRKQLIEYLKSDEYAKMKEQQNKDKESSLSSDVYKLVLYIFCMIKKFSTICVSCLSISQFPLINYPTL